MAMSSRSRSGWSAHRGDETLHPAVLLARRGGIDPQIALRVGGDPCPARGRVRLPLHDREQVAVLEVEKALLIRRVPLESNLQITPIHGNRHRSALSPHPSSPEGSTAINMGKSLRVPPGVCNPTVRFDRRKRRACLARVPWRMRALTSGLGDARPRLPLASGKFSIPEVVLARVTVEDCLERVNNRFALVVLGGRARPSARQRRPPAGRLHTTSRP